MLPDGKNRNPRLVRFYRNYLERQCAAEFVWDVAGHYDVATLMRLAVQGGVHQRRAALLALTYLGDFGCNAVFGRALCDRDRGVRMLAEDGIREIWSRAGNVGQRQQLALAKRLNDGGFFSRAASVAEDICRHHPEYGEAWNQRGIAQFFLGDLQASVQSCWRATVINPYQFEAAVGMGYAYLELQELLAALDCFRQALRVNPDLESIRVQVGQLERAC